MEYNYNLNNMQQADRLIQKITLLMQELSQGSWVDPEWDFTGYKELDQAEYKQADPMIYAKTGKLIHTTKVHKPLQIIFYFDLTINTKSRLHTSWWSLFQEVIVHFQWEAQIEMRDGYNNPLTWDTLVKICSDRSNKKDRIYHSDLVLLLDHAQYALQQGDIVLVISDFLYLMIDEGEWLRWLSCRSNSAFIPYLVPLPTRWINFHRYYTSYSLDKLPFDVTE